MSARMQPRQWAAAAIVLALTVFALVGPPLLQPHLGGTNYERARQAPNAAHWFGTDALGQDVLLQMADGLRVSLLIALGAGVASLIVGVGVGAVAAAAGGRVDRLLMRATDAVAAMPSLLVLLVVVAMFRGSVWAILVALALTQWTTVARIVRAQTQSIMSSDYVAVSRVAGATRGQIISWHVLPAVAGQAALALTILVPHAIWHESTLSFLGVGLQPEQASLGTIIAQARAGALVGQWWPLLFPAALLVVLTLAIGQLSPEPVSGLRRRRRAFGRDVGMDYSREQTHATEHAEPALAADDEQGLQVRDLTVRYGHDLAVDNVSLRARPGRVTAIVGESGAGKSSVIAACVGLLPHQAQTSGTMVADGHLVDLARSAGKVPAGVAYIPQDVTGAFTPTRHVLGQIEEIRRFHPEAASITDLAVAVRLDPALLQRYPHQLSGGQLARAAVAAALACTPRVLFADEPTAGLDPALADVLLAVLHEVAHSENVAVVTITHDIAAVIAAASVDEVLVMRDGRPDSFGPAREVFGDRASQYAAQLRSCVPGQESS